MPRTAFGNLAESVGSQVDKLLGTLYHALCGAINRSIQAAAAEEDAAVAMRYLKANPDAKVSAGWFLCRLPC